MKSQILSRLNNSDFFKSNIFKSIWYNLRIRGERGVKNPILFYGRIKIDMHYSSEININKGKFNFNKGIRHKEPFYGMLEMQENSKINVKGTFSIYSGAHVIVTKDSILNFGSGYINRNVKIKCFKRIDIGEDVAISENVTIWDSSVHEVIHDDYQKTESVSIGNHVWIGTNSVILKGVTIGDGAVIAAGSVVNRSIPPKCLAGGVPAKIIRDSIEWK